VFPLTAGGTFAAVPNNDGLTGTIAAGGGIEDVVFPADSPALTKGDTTLSGSYALDAANLSLGRGTLTLNTASGNPLTATNFAFYFVDQTHLKLVEIDNGGSFTLTGDLFSAPAGPFNATDLSGNYALSVSGTSAHGPYALTGVWTFNGNKNGEIIGGEEDFNDAGTATTAPQPMLTTTYLVSPLNGSLDRFLVNLKDGTKGRQYEYAVYLTASRSALLVETDFDSAPTGFGTGIVSSGISFPQAASSSIPDGGGFALGLSGDAISANGNAVQNTLGEVLISAASTSLTGTLDVNEPLGASAPATSVPLSESSAFTLPDVLFRGTATLNTGTAAANFGLIYYLIDDNHAFILDSDATRSAAGSIARQF
jgi:hypothetical protein